MTLEQFGRAAEIAKLAAEHDLHELSLRAVLEALRPGPPTPATVNAAFGRFAGQSPRRVVRQGQPSDDSAAFTQVEQQLATLDKLWRLKGAPPQRVYEALAEVVLPESRPAEIFIYPAPLQGFGQPHRGSTEPRSVGRLLARRAVDAGQVDDLKRRIEARQAQPLAELAARVLSAQLAAAAGDFDVVAANIAWLDERLKTDGLANSAELACHAVPGLNFVEQSTAGTSLLEAVAKGLAKQVELGANNETYSQLLLALARVRFKQGDTDAGRKHLEEFLASQEKQNARYGGDYGVYLRKQQLQQVATEFAEAGQRQAAWDTLGRLADIPQTQYSEPPLGDVVGRLARMFKTQSAVERYSMLTQWTLPAEGRRLVRVVAGFVATESRTESAPAPAEVASSVALLLEAAREAGRLDELAAATKTAAAEGGIENAETLHLLVEVTRGQGTAVASELRKLLDDRRQALPATNDRSRRIAWTDYLLMRACMEDDQTRPLGEELARTLITHSQRIQDHLFLSHCRSDLWASRAAAEPAAGLSRGQDPGLSFWHPVSHQSASTYLTGSTPAWWIAHEGHIAHVTGPEHEFLYFAYPLTGNFEFSVDAFEGGFGEGNFSYGGLVFEALHLGSQTSIWPMGGHERLRLPDPLDAPWVFHRLTIRVEPGRNRCYCNGHLFYDDHDPSPTSPWLALFSNRYMQTAFRDFTWKGEPQIPREVHLTHGDRMEGWIASFYGETQPPRRSIGRPDNNGRAATTLDPDPNAYDWRATEGVLNGRRQTGDERSGPVESRLYYHRPLRDGETIRYEFFYEPERFDVQPTVGTLAFVLRDDGVRLHLLSRGTPRQAAGPAPDDLMDEPAHRRGPPRLPLVSGDWNTVTLALAGDVLTLTLNAVEIYQWPMEAANERFFGFYHDKQLTASKVRNVVLSGDWPQRLSVGELADATRHDGAPDNDALRRVKHALIGEEVLSQNAGPIWMKARRLPPAERYALLRDWVLPNADHPTFRVRGAFTPVDPAPPVAAVWESITGAAPVGGKLVAPCIGLVAVAGELGQLGELAHEVDQGVAADDVERRGQLALLVLIALARDDDARAEECLREMYSLLKRLGEAEPVRLRWPTMDVAAAAPEQLRWPELIAATAALECPVLRNTSLAISELMVDQSNQWNIGGDWERAVRHLRGKALWLAHGDAQRQPFGSEPRLAQWHPVTFARAETRGRGWSSAHWRSEAGRLEHVPGHARDLAYFAVPLRGDFQVDVQLSSFGLREMELVYDAFRRVVRPDPKHLGRAYVGWTLGDTDLVPPLDPIGLWYDYRLVVRDGLSTAFVNGHKIHEQRLSAHPDPWLALFCEGHFDGSARNVRITGNPTVPDVVELSAASDLSAWRADYYGELLTGDNPAWRKEGDEIIAVKLTDVEGSFRESLLQYHRPMLEDGELEYEFFYQPGRTAVYPALDRLALVLDGDGVRVHWLTDAQFDRTGLSPDNLTEEPDNRRGHAALPLKQDEWNRLNLALVGDELTLRLNEVEIYQRTLEPSNRRVFGLFHYADQTLARVRRLRYRGQWPKVLPAFEAQELAVDPLLTTQFDAKSLPARFECDFRGRPIDPNLLRESSEVVAAFLHSETDGARITLPADQEKPNTAGYTTLMGIQGDFEVEAGFKSLAVKAPAAGVSFGSGIDLHLQFDGTDDHVIMQRRLQADGRHVLECGHGRRDPDGEYRWHLWQYAADATSGRFKFVRKGAVVYYMYAAGDDGEFVLFDERTAGKGDVKFCQVLARAFDRQSAVDVVLERLSVRAEKLSGK